MKKISLRWFLSFNLGMALVVQFLIVAALAWLVLLPQMRHDSGFHQHALTHAVAGDVSARVLDGQRRLQVLAEFLEAHPDLPDNQWTDLLNASCGDGETFKAIYITDRETRMIRVAGLARGLRDARPALMGAAVADAVLPEAFPRGVPFWSDPFRSSTFDRQVVAVTIAARGQAVTGEIAVDQLSAMIRMLSGETGMESMILDRNGLILADSRGIWQGRPLGGQSLPPIHTLHEGPGRPTAFDLHGRKLMGTITDIEAIGWKVLVAQSADQANRSIRVTLLTIALGLLIAMLLALTFTWFKSAPKLVRLFNLYSDQARAIAQGRYDVQRPRSKTREFYQLAESLQQMAEMIRQREQRIVASENNLKITLDSIGDAVIATDAHGQVTRMNPSAERLTGWALAQALGRPAGDVIHLAEDAAGRRVPDPAGRALADGRDFTADGDLDLIARSGEIRRVTINAGPIRGDGGDIIGAVMVLRDVSEIYAKERQIRESERLLKNLTANLPLVVYQIRVRPDGVFAIEVVNPQVARMLGLEVPEAQILPAFLARIPAEEQASLLASVRQAVDTMSAWHWEGRYRKNDTETIWFSGNAVCQQDGEEIIFYGFLMDTTERKRWESALKESERRFRDLFNEAPVMYVTIENRDMVPYVRDVNNLFLSTLGYPREEVIGKPLLDYYSAASRSEALELGGLRKALQGEQLAEERSLMTRDGQAVHTLLHTRPEYGPDGRVCGTRAMFLDITRRKRAEQESERLASALLQSQKMEAIGTLAGGIAHDFNNILSAVIGYADLSLKEVQKDTRLHMNLEQILVAGMRARDLVHQILAFSRQEEREMRPLQIGPLVKEALKLLRSSLPSTIEIRQQVEANLDNVLADPTQIHRIIMNLCTNAAHAMEEKGGVLTVTLSQVALSDQDVRLHPGLRPGHYLKLSVQDTGRGIPEAILTKIFDPYFTTKGKGKGTGLGLSVVHGILSNYGGAIFVYSEIGGGTIFHCYIPAIKHVLRAAEPQVPALPTGNEHILLVDDEPVIIEVAQMMLETLGYQVTACDNSPAALAIFEKDPQAIDLVLSDVTMPTLTGDRLTREMLRIRPDLPVILCTGFSDKVGNKQAAEIGARAIVLKPLIQKDLALLVRKVLDEARVAG